MFNCFTLKYDVNVLNYVFCLFRNNRVDYASFHITCKHNFLWNLEGETAGFEKGAAQHLPILRSKK